MSLIKLKLAEDNTVTDSGWANPSQRKAGDVTEDGFVIYDVDQDEINACVVDHTKLVNGHLVLDDDYTPPAIDDTKPEPTAEQLSITALAQQSADHAQHISSIESAITALAQANGGN